jgi:hypothetical protein
MNCEIFHKAEERLSVRQIADALRLYEEAERLGCDPDACAAGRWTCHMLAGNFPLAWRESEAIALRGNPDPHRFWDGRPVEGRHILIRCLHGLGDTLQFIRYAPLIRERARSLTIEAQPPLQALLARSGLADHVITWGEPEPPWDQQLEIVELPRIFRTTLDSIPNRVPYLEAPVTANLPAPSGRPLRVGVVWASSRYDPARSVPLDQMARLFLIPDVDFFGLQADDERFDLASLQTRVPNIHDESAGVLSAAQTLQTLDLLITVDTMMAHLAGALARPVWTLLPFACDWRWMLAREDSPWYPSMRLFRQPRPGDWKSVVDRVHCSLLELLPNR